MRRVDQFAQQFNCGSWGTFGYALCSVLGNQKPAGFEDCSIGASSSGPFLTIQLMPNTFNGQTVYTPLFSSATAEWRDSDLCRQSFRLSTEIASDGDPVCWIAVRTRYFERATSFAAGRLV